MRATNWGSTPLGEPSAWPQSLRTSVSTCLNCSFPILIWWGPELVKLYNDAYATILGAKHPSALGARGRDVWPEIWDVIGPMLDRVITKGEATPADDLMLMLERHGYAEECYFSFSYSPIREESGGIGGVFCPVIETTSRVMGERRLQLQRRLSEKAADLHSVPEVCAAAVECFSEDVRRDFPLVAFYQTDGDETARLIASMGLQPGGPAFPEVLSLASQSEQVWPLWEVTIGHGSVIRTPGLAELPRGPWDYPPTHTAVLALGATGTPAAFMIAGLNPCRPLEEMRDFAALLAGQISTSIGNALADEAERRRAEALAEIDQAKTAFFSNVSHEFRTPLTLMLGPLEDAMAETEGLPVEQRDRLKLAHRNALRLLRLVNALLDFSRIEAGRMQANYRPTDLAQLVADVASSFRSATQQAGLSLVVVASPLSQPAFVDCDMFETIVLNLLSNAFKFTFDGEIAVTLREEGGRARLTVRDTGAGISAAELPYLFDRFHRVEDAKGRSIEGSGIGLALVKELVLQHFGEITVESTVGFGTTFTLSVPLGAEHLPSERLGPARIAAPTEARAKSFVEEALSYLPAGDASSETHRLSSARSTADTQNRHRVLLADDNADLRGYIQRLLGEQGYDVEVVGNGEAALAAVHARKPELIVADVMMPRLDGFGLLAAVRSDAQLRDLPVILLSARAGEEAKVEGLSAGADDYLTKPFSSRDLLARVSANIAMARVRREAAEMVAASQARAGRVLAGMTEGYVLIDREYRVVEINDEALRIDGRTRADFIGRSHWDIWPGSETDVQGLLYKRVMEAGTPGSVEVFYAWEDGRNAWLEIDAYPVPDGLAIFYRDISARKLAAEAVAASEERLRHAVDAVQGILWTNNAAGEMEGEQPAWAALTGQAPEQYQGFGWSKMVHPDDAQPTIDAWNAAVSERRPFVFEHRVRRRDGEWRRFSIRAVPTLDAKGAITQWVGVHTDITDQRAAEARNRLFLTLADRLRELSDAREIAGAVAEVLGRHLDVSRAGYGEISSDGETVTFETSYANSVAPLVGTFALSAFGRDNVAELRRGITKVYADVSADPRMRDADFAARQTRAAMAVPLIREGRLRAALYLNHREVRAWSPEEVALVQDVAARTWDALERARAEADLRRLNENLEKRVAEEIEARERVQGRLVHAQRMEALGQLAGGIAHDFNNVLHAVRGGLSLIQKRAADPDDVRKLARMAIDASDRGAAITGRLLSFARRGELQPTPIDSRRLLEGLREILVPTLGRGIEIELDLAEDAPPLLADKPQLETVLINLAVNARDAMASGGKLTIRATAETVGLNGPSPEGLHPGHYLRLKLADNGAGMDAATLKRASEPFFTTKPAGQGTGLGLSMARGFVEQSGGAFSIWSELGTGTTVTIWLPVSKNAGGLATKMPEDIWALDGARRRALVVDDDSMVREVLTQQIQAMGFEATPATDGLDALSKLDGGMEVDVLVTDYSMPGMNGEVLIEEARRRRPSLPALLLTGFADGAIRLKFEEGVRENEFTALVRKPVDEDHLARQLAAVLSAAPK